MHVRQMKAEDWEAVTAIHEAAGYGYELPRRGQLRGEHVVEEDGKIVAFAAWEPTAQIIAAIDQRLTGPARRLAALKALHEPIAREILEADAQEVYAFTDPRYHGFGWRLMRMGWSAKLWRCYFIERKEIERVYGCESTQKSSLTLTAAK
jgi:hypothetical protein